MRKNYQKICDKEYGDCFRACVTSFLGIENDDSLPGGNEKDWFLKWFRVLGDYGLTLRYEEKACWGEGFWIASVKSKNFENITHSIIMFGQEVYFDPSLKKRYSDGENLLGTDVVLGGWHFELSDPSKVKFTGNKKTKSDAILDAIRKTSVGDDIIIHNNDKSIWCILTVKVKEHPESVDEDGGEIIFP